MMGKYLISFNTPGLLVKVLHDDRTVKTPCEFLIDSTDLSKIEDTIRINRISNYKITPVIDKENGDVN